MLVNRLRFQTETLPRADLTKTSHGPCDGVSITPWGQPPCSGFRRPLLRLLHQDAGLRPRAGSRVRETASRPPSQPFRTKILEIDRDWLLISSKRGLRDDEAAPDVTRSGFSETRRAIGATSQCPT